MKNTLDNSDDLALPLHDHAQGVLDRHAVDAALARAETTAFHTQSKVVLPKQASTATAPTVTRKESFGFAAKWIEQSALMSQLERTPSSRS